MRTFFYLLILYYLIPSLTYGQEEMDIFELDLDLFVIENPKGENGAFLITHKGVLVVGAGATPYEGKKIISLIRGVTNKPIKYLILTHFHSDHIDGMASFPSDVKIIAHSEFENNYYKFIGEEREEYINHVFPTQLANMKSQLDSIENKDSYAYNSLTRKYNEGVDHLEDIKKIEFRKPNIIFTDSYRLKLAEQRIVIEFPGAAHTSHNTIIKFSNYNTLYAGDLVYNKKFPYTIAEHGADVFNWIQILEDLSEENIHTVIPGQGRVGKKSLLKRQASYFNKLAAKVEELKLDGFDVEEIIKQCNPADYKLDGNNAQFPINIKIIYDQLEDVRKDWWKF
ncbi:MAG: MBL fold metallo-hydrolase [Bacteroidales bacterium]|nr:MBL fold metallo-hydrolase [Bacteroidales bacterium]